MKVLFMSKKILVFFICFNLTLCFIIFEKNETHSFKKNFKQVGEFENNDEDMTNSEFRKAWDKFMKKMKDSNYKDKSFDEDFAKYKYKGEEKILNKDTDSCLVSEDEAKNILENQGIHDDNIDKNKRFILGNCNPVLLVPGMLSTKLQVRINCTGLQLEDQDIYKKVKFYCGKVICEENDLEEADLFISATPPFNLFVMDDSNDYSGCLGYFLTFFNNEDACANLNKKQGKHVCNYSPHIKVGYYGTIKRNIEEGKCGLEAIRNVVMAYPVPSNIVNQGYLQSMGVIIKRLENKGYEAGFSLAGIPNDYRQFLAKNYFTLNSFRYLIERLYNSTGKPVVLIGHSFGTITLYNSLIRKCNKDLLPKIKKFIAVGPPFAGSSELIEVVFKGGNKYSTQVYGQNVAFDEFGFSFLINKLPTAIELRPLPIIGSLFTKPGYEIFADAIKERFFLEKKCGHKYCDDYLINRYSQKFNALFKDYFPLLTDEDCKFEKNKKDNNKYFDRKCLMDMFDMFNCPSIIEETPDKNGKLPNNFESYCGGRSENLYYQTNCQNSEDKQCLDKVYSKHIKYHYGKSSSKAKFFLDRWNNNEEIRKKYGEFTFESAYESEQEYKSVPDKQIEYYEEISLTKEMPTITVDTDIVYSTYDPTVAMFIFDKNDFSKDFNVLKKGGDGVVPNWSPIITGLKWIYDTKKYNLKTKVRLVEYCSRLSKNSKYAYDPKKEQSFAAIGCSCITEQDEYNSTDCSHGSIIGDEPFLEYMDTIINGNTYPIEQKINAINNYNSDQNYTKECDNDLLNIIFPNDPYYDLLDKPKNMADNNKNNK